MIAWPTQEKLKDSLPDCFKDEFPNCVAVIECAEMQALKKSHFLKYLIGKIGFVANWSLF